MESSPATNLVFSMAREKFSNKIYQLLNSLEYVKSQPVSVEEEFCNGIF